MLHEGVVTYLFEDARVLRSEVICTLDARPESRIESRV